MRQEILRLAHVTCEEKGVKVLNDFNLQILAGEIMGLQPLNDLGLETLLELLQQNRKLYYGYVYYREKPVNTYLESHGSASRIAVIEKRSKLVGEMSVADNVFVVSSAYRRHLIDPALLARRLRVYTDELGLSIPPDRRVYELTTVERYIVEMIKAIVAGARLIVLSEISTFISQNDLQRIHQIIRRYTADGISFLYVCGHHEELFSICDRLALMGNGQIIKILEPDQFTPDMLAHFIRWYADARNVSAAESPDARPVVLQIRDLRSGPIRDLTCKARAGECVVVQDLDNSVFPALLKILAEGQRPESGAILLRGQPFSPKRDARRLAVIQENPAKTMLFPKMTYLDNLCMTLDSEIPSVWRSRKVRNSLRREYRERLGNVFESRVDHLTMAQQYTLVYTRILLQKPEVVFCMQPFQGADMGLRIHILSLMDLLLQKGIALVILAVNLSDSLTLADRLVLVQDGATLRALEKDHFPALWKRKGY